MNKKEKTILCDAKAFCFGPISKLLAVSEKLYEKYNIIFLVSRTSKMLSGHAHADKIVECDTESEKDLIANEDLFKSADLFINIMNPISAKFAAERNLPIVEIDSLFWMWENISNEILNAEIYFIQNFEGVEKQLEKFAGKIKNPVLVGPIVKNFSSNVVRKNKLLINLGGMESASIKVGVNTNYPYVIAWILESVLSKCSSFDEIFCAGNRDILEKINRKMPNSVVRFHFFEHDDFLFQLAEAKLVISSPGLTTAFEAFNLETPILFLPPQNYSQYWNLDSFIKNNIAQGAINWNHLYPESNIIKNEEQKIGIEKVLQCTRKFENDKKARLKIEQYIIQIISLKESELLGIGKRQKKYFDFLGGNGTETICEKISILLDDKKH